MVTSDCPHKHLHINSATKCIYYAKLGRALSAEFLNNVINIQTQYAYLCICRLRHIYANDALIKCASGLFTNFLFVFIWQFIYVQHSCCLYFVNLRYKIVPSTIVHILLLTKMKCGARNVALRSNVINVIRNAFRNWFCQEKYFLWLSVMHLSSMNHKIICLGNRAKISVFRVFTNSALKSTCTRFSDTRYKIQETLFKVGLIYNSKPLA